MRKGSILDLPAIMAIILIFAISIIVGTMAVTEFRDSVENNTNVPDVSKDILDKGVNTMELFDEAFILFSIGVAAAVIVGALAVNSHPAFFVFSLILNIVMALVGGIFTNVYDSFATSSAIAPYANQFPLILTFMRNLPIFIFIIGLIIAVVMYAGPYEPGGGRA